MDKRLIILCSLAGLALTFVSFPDGALSVLLILAITLPAITLIQKYGEEKLFLTDIFLIALLLRIVLGVVIHIFDLRNVFGPDATLYDAVGQRLVEIWSGIPVAADSLTRKAMSSTDSSMGMYYVVGSIYYIFGRSILVAQSFCGTIGALTAPMVYFCAHRIFENKRVAKLSAIAVALFPSFIIWSSQLLKDGLIIFLLVCVMTVVLQLQKKFSYAAVVCLIVSLFGIISLRFYIFYMVAVAVAGSFVIGFSTSVRAIFRNSIIIVLLGISLTYLGVIRNAGSGLETYGNLERVQNSRQDLSTSADSGFGEDIDVSTPEGAILAIPVGLVYLFFAPFPWQVSKLNQALVLPETFLWWALIPIMISGLWYTIKYKLRSAIPILLFSLMLTLSYSIFQGNVGMLYRQRTQIQVFLFMFIAVGWTLFVERRENKKMLRNNRLKSLTVPRQSKK